MTSPATSTGEMEMLAQLTRSSAAVVHLNTEGITHDESLVQPQPGGNCLNFIVGHLIAIYNAALPLVGQEPVMAASRIARYDRGAAPITSGADAMPFEDLKTAWDEASRRFEAGLAGLASDYLDQKAPFSPTNSPAETNRSLLTTIAFHQAYHAGQTALARRLAGKPGAIK